MAKTGKDIFLKKNQIINEMCGVYWVTFNVLPSTSPFFAPIFTKPLATLLHMRSRSENL